MPAIGRLIDAPAEHLHHRLRRGPDERRLLVPEEVHVRRGVHLAQDAVHVERLVVALEVEPLREHDLEDVPGKDVLARRLDRALVLGRAQRRGERRQLRELLRRRRRRDVRKRTCELVHQLVEPAHGSGVRGVHRVVRRVRLEEDVLDQIEALPVVVERGDVTGQRQHRVGPALRVRRDVRQVLDLAHDVVPEVADDAAVERWQLSEARRAVPAQQRLDRRERAAIERDAGRDRAERLDLVAPHDEREGRVPPDEREAAPVLTVLDRLEQEAVAVADELDERGHRRLEVGQHLAPDRDDGVLARQRAELPERRLDDGKAHTGPGSAPSPNARKKQLRSPVWQAPRPTCSTTNRSTSMSQS